MEADMSDSPEDRLAGRHGQARILAEKAIAAEAAGDDAEAEALFAEANKIDPQAVEAALDVAVGSRPLNAAPPSDDAELEREERQMKAGADSKSRSGITETGSGADGERG
jgi:hypothetical protein